MTLPRFLRMLAAGEGVILSEVYGQFPALDDREPLTVIISPSGERSMTVLGVSFDYATDGGKLRHRSDLVLITDGGTTKVSRCFPHLCHIRC